MFTAEKLKRGSRTAMVFVLVGLFLNLLYVEDAQARGRRRGFRRGGGPQFQRVRQISIRRGPAVRRGRRVAFRRAPSRGFARNRRFGRRIGNVAPIVVANNRLNNGDLDIFGTSGNLNFGANNVGANALVAQQVAANSLFTPTFARNAAGQLVELNPAFFSGVSNPQINPQLLAAAQSNGGIIPSTAFTSGLIPQSAIRQEVQIGSDGRILFGNSAPFTALGQQNARMFNQGTLADFQRQALQVVQSDPNQTPVVSLRR